MGTSVKVIKPKLYLTLLEAKCGQVWELKTPERPSHSVDPTLSWVSPPGVYPGSHSKYWKKIPTDRNEEYVIGDWRKGNPCYKLTKTLAELCFVEGKSYEQWIGYLAEEISKQSA